MKKQSPFKGVNIAQNSSLILFRSLLSKGEDIYVVNNTNPIASLEVAFHSDLVISGEKKKTLLLKIPATTIPVLLNHGEVTFDIIKASSASVEDFIKRGILSVMEESTAIEILHTDFGKAEFKRFFSNMAGNAYDSNNDHNDNNIKEVSPGNDGSEKTKVNPVVASLVRDIRDGNLSIDDINLYKNTYNLTDEEVSIIEKAVK